MQALSMMLLLGAASAAAQEPAPASLTDDLLVPIHSHSEPGYGIWAAGSNFKVGFDGHFRFVPYLGEAYPVNQSLAWRTESVRVGETELVTRPAAGKRTSDYRYEYDLGGVVEAYDVSSASVEQTFLIPTAPANGGDLVVVGRIETPLSARARPESHAAITFDDDQGTAIVEYGAATAVDANGATLPMTSEWDGERLTLRLGEDSVSEVAFPLVVDPEVLSSAPTGAVGMVAITAAHSADAQRQVAFTRIASRGDHDAFAVRCDERWSPTTLVFDDITTAYSTNHITVTSTKDSFLIVYERRYSTRTDLRLFWQGRSVTAHNLGHTRTLGGITNLHLRSPSLGGSSRFPKALLVYDKVGAGTSTIRGEIVDTAAFTISAVPIIATPTVEVGPSVSPGNGDPEWVVCWAQTGATRSDVRMRTVQWTGTISLTTSFLLNSRLSRIYTQPRVAGAGGRYMLTYTSAPRVFGTSQVRALRFDLNGTTPTVIVDRLLHAGQRYDNGGVAYDEFTRSHWMATYTVTESLQSRVEFVRLGFAARVSKTVVQTGDRPAHAAVAYADPVLDQSLLMGPFFGAYSTDDSDHQVMGEELPWTRASMGGVGFDAGCAQVDPNDGIEHPTLVGSEFFHLEFPRVTSNPVVLLVGVLDYAIPLDPIGMTDCLLRINPLATLPAPIAPSSGRQRAYLPIPDAPTLLGKTFDVQWLWVEPGANPLGLLISHGVKIHPQ